MDFGVHRAREHVRFAYTIDQRKLEEGVRRLRDFLSR
jgi:aspartate/methionine/tyrosine aminotransferase